MVTMFSLDQDEMRSFRRGPQKHYLPQLTTYKSFGLVILEMKTLKVSANQKTEFTMAAMFFNQQKCRTQFLKKE